MISTARRTTAAALVALTVMAPLVVALAATPAAAATRTMKIVVLGDSYAAGNGARDSSGERDYVGPEGCYRSPSNWSSKYAAWLETQGYAVTLVNRACSGGVTRHLSQRRAMGTKTVAVGITGASDDELIAAARSGSCRDDAATGESYSNLRVTALRGARMVLCDRFMDPQIDAVTEDTDLVLLSSGGNDAEFSRIVKECFLPGDRNPGDCRDRVKFAKDQLDSIRRDLTGALALIRVEAPEAKVALVGYPLLANHDDFQLVYRRLGLAWESDRYDASRKVRELGRAGNDAQRRAVEDANDAAKSDFARFVSVQGHFQGREPSPDWPHENPDRWVRELEHLFVQDENYHYNARGHLEVSNVLKTFGTFGTFGLDGSPSGGSASIDLAFVVDTTGSMGDDIDAVKDSANRILDVLDAGTRSYRVAVVDYRDFPERTFSPGDYPARVRLDFSTDRDAIRSAIDGLDLGDGGDGPETMWSGLMTAFDLDWRPGVKKMAVQFGDAPALNPEPITGFTTLDVIAASLAIDPVAVYAVDTGFAGQAIRDVAMGTGGEVLSAPSPALVAQRIEEILDTAIAAPFAWTGTGYVGRVGAPIVFDAAGSFDADGEIVSWEWDVDGDGTFDASSTTESVFAHTYTTPYAGLVTLRVTDDDGLSALATASVDASVDGDGVPPGEDNCVDAYNHGQSDADGDGVGDECDADATWLALDQPGVGVAFGDAPAASILGGPYRGTVGAPIPIEGQVSDPAGDAVTPTWLTETPDCRVAEANRTSTNLQCDREGTHVLRLLADDGHGGVVAAETTVDVGVAVVPAASTPAAPVAPAPVAAPQRASRAAAPARLAATGFDTGTLLRLGAAFELTGLGLLTGARRRNRYRPAHAARSRRGARPLQPTRT